MTGLRVYYNSRCPVCDAGIRSQRRRMQAAGAGTAAEWRDINDEPDALRFCGAGIDDVRRKLYVLDADGNVHIGAAAFTALWRTTPGQRWLARLLSLPPLAAFARWSYDGFAALLYAWNRRQGRW
jgi:predicted DCC family thiol-disulfide oxidoreductase YuxK